MRRETNFSLIDVYGGIMTPAERRKERVRHERFLEVMREMVMLRDERWLVRNRLDHRRKREEQRDAHRQA